MLGIVVNGSLHNYDISILIYDYENGCVREVTPKFHCIHSNYMPGDFVYYDSEDGGVFKFLRDKDFLMYIDDLIMIYKSYLAMARDIKIDYLNKNNITLEYNTDEEAKELFKKVCKEYHIIRRLEGIEWIINVLLTKMKDCIDDNNLYFKFFANEVEKKHSYR